MSLVINLSGVFGAVNSPKGVQFTDKPLKIKDKTGKNEFLQNIKFF
jgi:hypothetical protein